MSHRDYSLAPNDIAPIIRGANYMITPSIEFGPRVNFGYQLFYLVAGSVSIRIGAIKQVLEAGDFVLYGPRSIHKFKSLTEITFFTICFSWNKETAVALETGNLNVRSVDDDFLCKADPPVQVVGLPELPFIGNIKLRNRPHIETIMLEIGSNFHLEYALQDLRNRGLLMEILYLLLSNHTGEYNTTGGILWVRRFFEYLSQHYMDALDRQSVSQALGISESYLTTILRQYANTNFTDSLTSTRMHKAQEMLKTSTLSIKEIAVATGFASTSYFSARFRNFYGASPRKNRS